ncbi:MAG: thioesterase domain-containing protein, partial [Acidobacteriota bacterium]|nr:thioesterase domain-containing protein [Acidobacteriota bacterium]
KQLVAYLVIEGEPPSNDEIRRFLRQSLPEYMVPRIFVSLSALPLTPNGKVDRHALPSPDQLLLPSNAILAPRNEDEEVLQGIWEKVLGLSKIGVTDNFFELGGHSLLAVKLMAEIQRVTGKLLPLAALFQSATIESLARVLHQDADDSNYTILQIQGGNTKPAFFAIVTPGVNALGYVALARHLGEDQPFYRIQGPGSRVTDRPYSKDEFDNLALQYIEAMKTVQPKGPYYLGGMCEGARIAFDMARYLEARGDKVALLAILDTWVVENSQNRILWQIAYYTQRWRGLRSLTLAGKTKEIRRSIARTLKRLVRVGTQPKSSWPSAYWPGKEFVPPKYHGKITVFKIPKQPFYYVRDPLMGWGKRTTDQVEVQAFAGEHNFILREPYVESLGKELRATLNKLNGCNSLVGDSFSPTAGETQSDSKSASVWLKPESSLNRHGN